MNKLIIKVGTALVVLTVTALACTGALAAAQKRGTQLAGAPINPPKSSNPQSPTPEATSQEAPAGEAAPQSLEADPLEMAAPPSLQFKMSTNTVNFGGGPLVPQSTPYTQLVTASINSNTSWRIFVTKDHDMQGTVEPVASQDFTFSAVGPAGRTTYQAPTGTQFGTDVLVVEGTRGSNLQTAVTYSLLLQWSLLADNYSATQTYTALQI
jgi:hypothetical protein